MCRKYIHTINARSAKETFRAIVENTLKILYYKAHNKMLHCFQNFILWIISLNFVLSNIVKKQKESNHKQSYSNILQCYNTCCETIRSIECDVQDQVKFACTLKSFCIFLWMNYIYHVMWWHRRNIPHHMLFSHLFVTQKIKVSESRFDSSIFLFY